MTTKRCERVNDYDRLDLERFDARGSYYMYL
jgi:hypothetical protein